MGEQQPALPTWNDLRDDSPPVDWWDLQEPQFGEQVREWSDILNDVYWRPSEDGRGEPSGYDTSGMQRLRGLIMVQAAETEAVLGRILRKLDPQTSPGALTAGALLKKVWEKLSNTDKVTWQSHVRQIRKAQKRRNHAVHNSVDTGYTWADYATGGGEWVPVITTMGNESCDGGN
ncbi:hypothetical protein L1857_11710 [Amycolatopsis thermalba]|uniref:DUF4145 domain-containing protein n=1 Tax=Amycolatopsis thermalba TaxID=944492 RepID=A0ABY4NTR1_9PSEU|nr:MULTISPECIES: hypothetical protein [Amycolatopsis]UQS23442.1 hypothetical protein L1857_11710 [Amycolatopsis thermalba]